MNNKFEDFSDLLDNDDEPVNTETINSENNIADSNKDEEELNFDNVMFNSEEEVENDNNKVEFSATAQGSFVPLGKLKNNKEQPADEKISENNTKEINDEEVKQNPIAVNYEKEENPNGKGMTKLIDGLAVACNETKKEIKEFSETPSLRQYTNKIPKQDIVHKKPVEAEKPFLPKLIMFLCGCIAVGSFLGVKANSYYLYKSGKVESIFSCAISWVMEENMPTAITPFVSNVFFTAFFIGAGVLGVIGLLAWLDNDSKKQSRVGHEHGNARLGTKNDFKKYKNQFMD